MNKSSTYNFPDKLALYVDRLIKQILFRNIFQ